MESAAAFLLSTKALNTICVLKLTATDSGAHWILSTKEDGEIVHGKNLNCSCIEGVSF